MSAIRKKPWDIVPEMSEASSRSMKSLAALAATVVQDVLGPSPQADKEAEDEETYQRALADWHHSIRRIRGMSDDEYEEAIVQGFPGPCPVRPEQRAQGQLDAWLREKLRLRLMSRIDEVLMDVIGIENNYGTMRLKNTANAPFASLLSAKARDVAHDMVKKWADENPEIVFKPAKMDEISAGYRRELEVATRMAISERIKRIAQERAESIRAEVLEAAVDEAMFDTYPVLRRMDALSRLGAKPEAEAE